MKKIFPIIFSLVALFAVSCEPSEKYDVDLTPMSVNVTTGSAEITATSAVLHGTVSGLSSQSSSAYSAGMYVSSSPDPVSTGTRTAGSVDQDGNITVTINGLNTGQTLYYAAYVLLQKKLTYTGAEATLVTTDAKIENVASADVSAGKATVTAMVSGVDGISESLSAGIYVARTAENVANGIEYAASLDGGKITGSLKGLIPCTTYYAAPYLDLGTGIIVGDAVEFTTGSFEYEFVDLGIGTMWATVDVGAEAEGEYGALMTYADISSEPMLPGRMPTETEVRELLGACSYEWTTVGGNPGYKFTGENGNSVFFPAAGYRDDKVTSEEGVSGTFWTSTASSDGYMKTLAVNASSAGVDFTALAKAISLRPVQKAPFKKEMLVGEWKIDIDPNMESIRWNGPMYFYDTSADWMAVSEGTPSSSSYWSWEADWADWIMAAGDHGTMTLTEDGKAIVNGVEGTYTVDETNARITFSGVEMLHDEGHDGQIDSFTDNLAVLSAGSETLQIAVIRTEDPCALSYNFVKKELWDDNQKGEYEGAPAYISYASSDWSVQVWGDHEKRGNADVTGYGTYTHKINLSSAASGAIVFVVDIFGLGTKYPEMASNITATVDKITLDGVTDIPVDNSKIICGDIENNGNYRIEIYNEYGAGTASDSPIDLSAFNPESSIEVPSPLPPATPLYSGVPGYISYAAGGWYPSVWGDASSFGNVDVTGFGTYTQKVTFEAEGDDVIVFVIDIAGYKDFFGEDVLAKTTATVDKILVNGSTEVPVDNSKIICGDIENNGNFRIEIYNEYGAGTAADPPIDKSLLTGVTSVEVTFTLSEIKVKPESFYAGISFSSSTWWPSSWFSADNLEGAVEVTGDGQYTATVTLPEATTDALVFVVDILGISEWIADIDAVTATVDKIMVDSTEIEVDNSKILYGDIEGNGNFRIEIFNQYGAGTASNPPIDASAVSGTDISVTFTLSGVTF